MTRARNVPFVFSRSTEEDTIDVVARVLGIETRFRPLWRGSSKG
jgi:hypothetical protein